MRIARESAKTNNVMMPASLEMLEPRLLLQGTFWAVEAVDTPGNVGQFTSMATDNAGHSYVSYYDATNGDLKYATNVSGSWVVTTVDSAGDVGKYTSIALDSSDNPHISYVDSLGRLKYAAYNGATWSAPVVVDSTATFQFTSLDIAADGTPHIAYFSVTDRELEHAWYTGAVWNTETVDTGNQSTTITESNDNLNQLSQWDLIDGVHPDQYIYVNIVSEGGGNYRVDLYGNASRTSLVAHSTSYSAPGQVSIIPDNGSGIGGSLTIDAVIGEDFDILVHWPQALLGWVGPYCSLKVADSGHIDVTYYDVSNGHLMYAVKAPAGTWTKVAIQPSQPNVGEYTSLQLDELGRGRVSYYEVDNNGLPTGNLRYAAWSAGEWYYQTIDSVGDVGLFTSLALDAAGQPVITYLDYTNGNLKIARFDGTQWNLEVLDNLGWDHQTQPGIGQNVGFSTAVDILPNGSVAVAYYNYGGGNLNFAYQNQKPTLTTVDPLQGATEDTPFTIAYDGPTGLLVKSDAQDAEGDEIFFRIESVTAGTLTMNGNPVIPGQTLFGTGDTLEWVPPADANGITGAFTVVAWTLPEGHVLDPTENTAASSPAVQVSVNLLPSNDAPTLTTISNLAGTEDTPLTISYATLLAASDAADIDGDTLSFRVMSVTSGTLTKNGVAVVPGTTLLNSGGSPLIWTPGANEFGVIAAFTVVAFDGTAASSPAVQVKVDVAENNAEPTLTSVSTLSGTEDTPLTITYAQLAAAANEADSDGDTISFRIESVSSGTLTKGGVAVIPGETLVSTGDSLVWTPALNANGVTAAFTMVAWDGRLTSAPAVQVNVQLAPVNDPPTLTTISTLPGAAEDAPFTITYATLLAASNMTDPDATDTLSFRVETVTSGTLTQGGVAVTPGTTLLTPTSDPLIWTPDHNVSGDAIAAFTVKAWDGTVASSVAVTVRVDVAPDDTIPTLSTFNTLTGTTQNTPFTISYAMLAAASTMSDADGDTLSFRIESVTTGTLTKSGVPVIPGQTLISVGESVVWTPATNATGVQNAFTVVAWDGTNASNPARQVSVQVTPNSAPDFVAFVDLSKVGRKVVPGTYRKTATSAVKKYKMPSIPFLLTNNGTAIANGYVTVDLYASTDAVLDTGTATKIQSISLKVKGLVPGATKKFNFPEIVAPDLGAGHYYMHVVVNPGDQFLESNYANNTASSDRTIEWYDAVTAPPLPNAG